MFSSKSQSLVASEYQLDSCYPQDILGPLSPASINTKFTIDQPARKRKHEEISKNTMALEPLIIQPPSLSPLQETLRLAPQLLISRSCLPLASLDQNGTPGALESNRLFSAHISALEEGYLPGSHSSQQTILIAASDMGKFLYAVERVRHGVYALCRLATWVTLKELKRMKDDSTPRSKTTSTQRAALSGNEWWHVSAIEEGVVSRYNEPERGELAGSEGFRLCMKPPDAAIPLATALVENPSLMANPGEAPSTFNTALNESISQQATHDPDDTFGMIRAQYQEALYMSQASLAYFAKGPLSRARALFINSDSLSMDGLDLPEYLRTCILSLPTMDKKYRETLPILVSELPLGVFSENENEAISATLRKRSRKSKKSKIGKDGLYPGEELSIVRWWLNRGTSTEGVELLEGREELIRKRLLAQRARETQLQIILVLETLALEVSKLEKTMKSIPIKAERGLPSLEKKQKTRKLQDLHLLLDLLVDRLCIWQSMDSETDGLSMNQDILASQMTWRAPIQAPKVNVLRNLCIEVILPFYYARLPDLSSQLCQKLGGPKPPSPARPSLRKAATSSQVMHKPGAVAQRPPARRPRRTLELVLTEERSASQNPPPLLSRSATDSALPRLKREVSEVSLSSILPNATAISKSRRYSQREVDLSVVSQAYEAKIKKKASVEQELHGAIAALKRPNSRLAVKELLEAAEKRVAGSNLRKLKNPARNPFAQGVQVMATPKGNRQKDVFRGLPCRFQPYRANLPEVDEVPPSSALRFISATPNSCRSRLGGSQKSVLPTIEQTPSRGPSKHIRPCRNVSLSATQPDGLPPPVMTPTKPTHPTKPPATMNTNHGVSLGTGSKPNPFFQIHEGLHNELEDTPIKKGTTMPANTYSKPTPLVAGDENVRSIYENLGWEDEVDEAM